jgi:hypothetical protein
MRGLAIVVVLAAATTSAHADGFYYTEGFAGVKVRDELSAYYPDGAMRIRLGIGMRRGNLAFEGYMGGLVNLNVGYEPDGGHETGELMIYGLDVKYLQTMSPHVEVYLRGGLGGAEGSGGLTDYSGRSLGVGAGIQVKRKGSIFGLLFWPLFFLDLPGPKMTGALWLDAGYDFYRLHGPAPTAIDASLHSLGGGLAIGSDF